jgi:hypothetical protein
LCRQAGLDFFQVIARIQPTSTNVANGIKQACIKLRNSCMGRSQVSRDLTLFDRLLQEAFEEDGGVVCRVGFDQWRVFTGADGAESRVRAVAASFAEMTPFTFDGAYTVRSTGGEERAARLTGAGRFQRAFRCVMDRLVPGEEPSTQYTRVADLLREANSEAPLNTPFWIGDWDCSRRNNNLPQIQWLSISQLTCPFCHSLVRVEGQPVCKNTFCAVCQAHFKADFWWE